MCAGPVYRGVEGQYRWRDRWRRLPGESWPGSLRFATSFSVSTRLANFLAIRGIFNGVTGHVGPAVPGGPSDADLVRAAQEGDAASLGALLDRYRASLYARGLAYLGRPEDAADAVQDTFLLALTRLGQVRDPEAVGGWLHAVMRSVCAMELRRPVRRVTAAEIDDRGPAAPDAVEQ